MTDELNKEESMNEFDDIDTGDEDAVPEQTFSDVPEGSNNLVANDSGQKYDWKTAPAKAKAPPRIDLDGQEVIIESAEIMLPPASATWTTPKNGVNKYKYCQFVLFFNKEGQQEFYSGVRVFQNKDGSDKHGHPTIQRNRKTQASKLIGHYADFKEKSIEAVSMREFMAFLNSKPKAVIKQAPVTNPETNDVIMKNFIDKFI